MELTASTRYHSINWQTGVSALQGPGSEPHRLIELSAEAAGRTEYDRGLRYMLGND